MPKPGYITASSFNSVMTKTVGKTVLRECCRIACERIGVKYLDEQYDISYVRSIEWGNENEPLAIAAYEAHEFVEVHSREQFHQVTGMMVGGHPDGLVGDDGMIEVKCPDSGNHLLNLTRAEQLDDYIYQIQAYLWITGREWCDFVSFDPRFPDDLQLYKKRVMRDEGIIEAIRERARVMEELISDMVHKARPGLRFNPNGMTIKTLA